MTHDPATCPCPCHAKKRAYEVSGDRKAYKRDMMRGLRHRAAGKPMEHEPSDAYRVGWGRMDRG